MTTEEQSTLVREPIDTTRPRVIGYILDNIERAEDVRISSDVPGIHILRIGTQPDDYAAFLAEIERKDRDYPLILVSPTTEGKYLVNRQHLQDALFGLGQVVEVVTDFDRFQMEQVLGRKWSAWGGAINIIQTPRANGYVHGSLFRSQEIETLGERQGDRVGHLLARVTHHTNIPRSRNRIRPEGVVQLALRRRLQTRSSASNDQSDLVNLKAENQQLWNDLISQEESYGKLEIERGQAELKTMELEDQVQELLDKIRSLEYKNQALRPATGSTSNVVDYGFFLDLATNGGQPSPEECLQAISAAYPARCEILDSAWKSAKEMSSFQNGRRLLALLRRLVTDYFDALLEGGDNNARKVFTSDEYSATESETVQNSSTLSEKRVFFRNGQPIEMFRHLKIGKADNVTHTLRVHFAWISSERKIVIGHCGEHLPIASH